MHLEGAGECAPRGVAQRLVAAGEPAGDRVAIEIGDRAAHQVNLTDKRVIHAIELAREFFRAEARAQRAGEGFGQRGEAGNIGEQDCPGGAGRNGEAIREAVPPIKIGRKLRSELSCTNLSFTRGQGVDTSARDLHHDDGYIVLLAFALDKHCHVLERG